MPSKMWSLSLSLIRCHSTVLLLLPLHQRTKTHLSSRFHTSAYKISATTKANQQPNMEENKGDSSIISLPNVEKMRVLLSSDSKDGWDKCWEEGLTPWDLGGPTPVILHLLQTESLPNGRVLVPGCGSGHDVMAIASPERYVVGLDSSNNAINKAKQLSMSLSNANYLEFVKADFFDWNPTRLFDLFFDYTFFCAIEPCLRSSWASRIAELLKPDGELITLMFPISDHVGGPPFKVSVSDYEEVLHPLGFKAISVVDNDLAIGPRKGTEKLGRWKRSLINHPPRL